ncbi:MAG: hypothetical protein WC916_03885 [Candidatus Woesearchaeota archaeon]
MKESIENAVEELKRVDHSIFVSLKYTRTVDILINILTRMVDCYEFLFESLLKYALEHKLAYEIPNTPKERCVALKRIYKEQEVHDNVDLYLLLKAMLKTTYTRENEYRRHVTMKSIIAGREEIININIISQYYEVLTSFFHFADNLRTGVYTLGTKPLVTDITAENADEENPGNPYWSKVKEMREEADAEIAREKEMRERLRQEKTQQERDRQKEWDKRRAKDREKEQKKKRITKRKPKIIPKRIIPKDKLRMVELQKQAKKNAEKKKKANAKKKKK